MRVYQLESLYFYITPMPYRAQRSMKHLHLHLQNFKNGHNYHIFLTNKKLEDSYDQDKR